MFFEPFDGPVEDEPNVAFSNTAEPRNRETLIVTAQRAAAENKSKAVREAIRGAFHFAKIHEAASISYEEDAEAMKEQNMPIHRSINHYIKAELAYRRLDKQQS